MVERIFVSGQSVKRYGGAGAYVVAFPLGDKYTGRKGMLKKCGGFVEMEVRGVTLALNQMHPGQEVEVLTLCEQVAGYVRRKGRRSWGSARDVKRELRDALRAAISRHKSVGAVSGRKTQAPEPLLRARGLAMDALGMTQADIDAMAAKRKAAKALKIMKEAS